MDKKSVNVKNEIQDLHNSVNDISYKVNGSVSDPVANIFDKKISSLTKEMEYNCNNDIIGSLRDIMNKSNVQDRVKFQKIKDIIEDTRNANIVNTLFNDMKSHVSKLDDLITITSIMPQLKEARRGIVNNILSPDDVTKKISLALTIDGEDINGSDKYKALNTSIKEILKEVKFEKLLRQGVDKTVTVGKYYFAVLPYSHLYAEIIKNKNKLNESSEIILNENDFTIYDEEAFKNILDPEYKLSNVKSSMVNFVNNNVSFSESSTSLFNDKILLHEIETLQEKKKTDTKNDKSFEKQYPFKDSNSRENKNSTQNDGFIDTNDDKNTPNIKGCKIKSLDPRRLIPLKIDDTCLGYYYIETQESIKAIQHSVKFKFKDITKQNMEDGIDMVYKSLGDLISRKIDKKFIEDNAELKDRLYDIVKYSEDSAMTYKITYLKPELVHEFEIDDGESPFEQALFFSKLYMLLLMTSITAKVTRSNDVRAYYVDVDAEGPTNAMLNNAINTLKRQNRSIIYYNNIQQIMSSSTVFDDIFLGKTSEGKNPIDYDIIQGQDVDIPTDVLEMLEKIAVDSTGLPLQLIQSGNEADFAKTYSMLNIKFLKRIVDFQSFLNPSITSFIIAICSCYINEDAEDFTKLQQLEASLQAPIEIQITNLSQQIENAKTLAQSLAEIMLGSNNEDQLLYDRLVFELVKKYVSNADWTQLENIKKDIMNKIMIDKLDTNSEEGYDDIPEDI